MVECEKSFGQMAVDAENADVFGWMRRRDHV